MRAAPGAKFGVAWMIRPDRGAYYWQQADVLYWGVGDNVDSPLPDYAKLLEDLEPLALKEDQVLSLDDPNILEFTELLPKIPTADGNGFVTGSLFVDTDWHDTEGGSRVFSTQWTLTPVNKDQLKKTKMSWAYGPMGKDFT